MTFAAGTDIFDPTNWINFGVTGVVIVALIFGWLWPRPGVDQLKEQITAERTEKEKAQVQRDEAYQVAQEKILPLLNEFVQTTQVLMPLLQDLVARRRMDRRDD
jgi:hypothetical protein